MQRKKYFPGRIRKYKIEAKESGKIYKHPYYLQPLPERGKRTRKKSGKIPNLSVFIFLSLIFYYGK